MGGLTYRNKIGSLTSGKVKPTTLFIDTKMSQAIGLIAVHEKKTKTDMIHEAFNLLFESRPEYKQEINKLLKS